MCTEVKFVPEKAYASMVSNPSKKVTEASSENWNAPVPIDFTFLGISIDFKL